MHVKNKSTVLCIKKITRFCSIKWGPGSYSDLLSNHFCDHLHIRMHSVTQICEDEALRFSPLGLEIGHQS